jgi:hypothetical protein
MGKEWQSHGMSEKTDTTTTTTSSVTISLNPVACYADEPYRAAAGWPSRHSGPDETKKIHSGLKDRIRALRGLQDTLIGDALASTDLTVATDDFAEIFDRLPSLDELPPDQRDRARLHRLKLGPPLKEKGWSIYDLVKNCRGETPADGRTPRPIYGYFNGVQKKARLATRRAIAIALQISVDEVPA